jgi:hypothetical protein
MLHHLKKWYPENDPLTREQVKVLISLLDETLTEKGLEGFLIVCSRFVDEFGHHRTKELANIFRTDCEQGKQVLLSSLEYMQEWVGGMDGYENKYPVTVVPAKPAFPQFKIIGIEKLSDRLYRVLDSKSTVYPTGECTREFIARTGRLPFVPRQRYPVRRSKPRYHWCSYNSWSDPESTREALQILPEWSDCKLRATVLTTNLKRSAYVAFNGDRKDPSNSALKFYKYFYEPHAQDHPPFIGGGTQIALEGSPIVDAMEQWDDIKQAWKLIYSKNTP